MCVCVCVRVYQPPFSCRMQLKVNFTWSLAGLNSVFIPRLVAILWLKSPICPSIYLELEGK